MAYKQEASSFGFPSALLQNAGFGSLKANLRRTLLLAFTNPPCTNIGLVLHWAWLASVFLAIIAAMISWSFSMLHQFCLSTHT
jgi:hypothetical protein